MIKDPFPVRFMTYEDAMLFVECIRTKVRFPPEKYVWPFKMDGTRSVPNPEYEQAIYELEIHPLASGTTETQADTSLRHEQESEERA